MSRSWRDPRGEDEAFENELEAAPWAFGQAKPFTLHEILTRMRCVGLDQEADWLVAEMIKLSLAGES